MKEVEAAGGLVRDSRGRCLLILRNGVWDLPKGHREEGEDLETCAVREVAEETGAHSLECGALICVTDHTYFRDGCDFLKHTWWYEMKSTSPQTLVPQKEEGIEEVRWVETSLLPEILADTYPTIREVFAKAKLF